MVERALKFPDDIPGCCPLCISELENVAKYGKRDGITLSARILHAAKRIQSGAHRTDVADELRAIAAVIEAGEAARADQENDARGDAWDRDTRV